MDIMRHLQKSNIVQIDGFLARKKWGVYRQFNGYKPNRPLFAQPTDNMKTAKAEKLGIAITMGLALAQALISGDNACRYKTDSCESSCVGLNGMRRFNTAQAAAILRTRWLMADPSAFISLMLLEALEAHDKWGGDLLIPLGLRGNTFSDIPWEIIAPWLFEDAPHLQWYDYTKWPRRETPANYHLTFSASERTSNKEIVRRVESGQNVAVVFSTPRLQALPESYLGQTVIDGDTHDARFLDPQGVIVGLRAKGRMKKLGAAMVHQVA